MKEIKLVLIVSLALWSFPLMAQTQTTTPTDTTSNKDLEEVVVQSQLPYVRVADGRLRFQMKHITQGKNVTNALEAISRVPGLMFQRDKLVLAGASTVHILINGQRPNATPEQVLMFLYSLPHDRIAEVEVMYQAPAQTGVQGAAINVILQTAQPNDRWIAGLASNKISYEQSLSNETNLSLSIVRPKSETNLQAAVLLPNSYRNEDYYTKHQLSTNPIPVAIDHNTRTHIVGQTYVLGGDYRYSFSPKRSIKVALYGQGKINKLAFDGTMKSPYFQTINNTIYTIGNGNSSQTLISNNTNKDKQLFVQGSVAYEDKDLGEIEVGLTTYSSNRNQSISLGSNPAYSIANHEEANTLFYSIRRAIDRIGSVSLNYGVRGSYNKTGYNSGLSNFSYLTENHISTYFGASWSFSPKLTMNASLGADYQSNDVRIVNTQHSHRWDVFPTLSALYMPNQKHIYQLSLSTFRGFPPYFALTNASYYLNAYKIYRGNTDLTPYRNYNLSLQYILNQKHVVGLFSNYIRGSIHEQLYFSPNTLEAVNQMINFDYVHNTGILLASSGNLFEGLSYNASAIASWTNQSISNFHGISDKWSQLMFKGDLGLEYKLPLPTKSFINLDLSGYTATRQGLYQIRPFGQVGISGTYHLIEDKLIMKVGCPDIFGSAINRTLIDSHGMYERMSQHMHQRYVYLSLSLRIGNQSKKPQAQRVDTSRYIH